MKTLISSLATGAFFTFYTPMILAEGAHRGSETYSCQATNGATTQLTFSETSRFIESTNEVCNGGAGDEMHCENVTRYFEEKDAELEILDNGNPVALRFPIRSEQVMSGYMPFFGNSTLSGDRSYLVGFGPDWRTTAYKAEITIFAGKPDSASRIAYLNFSCTEAPPAPTPNDQEISVAGEQAANLISALDNAGLLKGSGGKYQANAVYCSSHNEYPAYHCLLKDINRSSALVQIIGDSAERLMSALQRAGLREGTAIGISWIKSFYLTCTLAQENASCTLTSY